MDAHTRLCCLIGKPVGHSLSPLIHNTLAAAMGINMVYTAFAVDEMDVGAAIRGASAMGFGGLNVTVPHKCAVIPELVELDPLAEHIGAVNTLVPVEGGFKGYNTDIIGLKRELEEAGITIAGQEVIILGAGGASNAITYLCASEGASRIWLMNRSLDRAKRLATEVNSHFPGIVKAISLTDYHIIPKGH